VPDPTNAVLPRLVVLEEIAKNTKDALIDLRTEMRAFRAGQGSDFRWLLGIILGGYVGLLGMMAHGFHWF
jgi:hypothetical protein